MKIDHHSLSKLSVVSAIGALALSGAAALGQATSVIFQDDFEQHYLGDVPGSPWSEAIHGEEFGSVKAVADLGGRFDGNPDNQMLEWRKLGPEEKAMALRAYGVFEEGAQAEVVTFSFDFLDSGWTTASPFVSLFLYAGGGTSSANITQRITIGRGDIGNAKYTQGVVARADIVFNNSSEPLTYRDGAQTIQPGNADIWIDGKLVGVGYRHANHATLGGITGFQLNSGGSGMVVAWFDNLVVRNEPFVRETWVGETRMFVDDFNFHPENAQPGAPWTRVLAGEGRGSMLAVRDTENLFGRGADNQFVEYIGDGLDNPLNLQANHVFSAEEAPEIGTFSFKIYEPDVETGKGTVSFYAYMDNIFSANTAHRVNFGGGRIGGFTYGYDRAVQVDYVVNSSAEPLVYRDGERTLPAGLSDVWVDGVLAVPGLETANSQPGGLRSFQITSNSAATPLIYIDDFVFRNEAFVSGASEPETDAYRGWQELHFSETELADPAIGGDEADPDGDGMANLLEYALGSEPREASLEKAPVSAVSEVGGEEFLTMEFRKPDGVEGVEYRIEVSGDLVNWTYNGDATGGNYTEIVEEAAEDNATRLVVRDVSPVSESGRRFIRLRVLRNSDGV